MFLRSFLGWNSISSREIKILEEHKKCVFVFQHTSYLDFVSYLSYFLEYEELRKRATVIVKDELMDKYGKILSMYGCIKATNREKKNGGLVTKIAEELNKKDEFIFLISPKGTSKKRDDWRTGYYYIASLCKCPIIVGGFDYSKKEITISNVYKQEEFLGLSPDELTLLIKRDMNNITPLNKENAECNKQKNGNPSIVDSWRMLLIILIVIILICVFVFLLSIVHSYHLSTKTKNKLR